LTAVIHTKSISGNGCTAPPELMMMVVKTLQSDGDRTPHTKPHPLTQLLIMVALCNRADHYIFAL